MNSLKVHMHVILLFVFHIFLVSFKNRQGQGPELLTFLTHIATENALFHSAFSAKTVRFTQRIRTRSETPRICRECKIPLHWIHCQLPWTHSFTPRFRQQWLVQLGAVAENPTFFHSAFSPKELNTIQKLTVSKTTLSVGTRFRRQRLVTLRTFSENGE